MSWPAGAILDGVLDNGVMPSRALFLDTTSPQITLFATVSRGHDKCYDSHIVLQVNIESLGLH